MSTNPDTNHALVHALQPLPLTGVVNAIPGLPAVEAVKKGTHPNTAATEKKTSRSGRESEGGNKDDGNTHPAQVFLDSGCLTGSYIKEELAKRLTRNKTSYFIPCITKVCGAFGGCELSTRKLQVHIAMPCVNLIKNFQVELKVVKQLPYEIMLGRQDMFKHDLALVVRTGFDLDI
jgi:hypothetical protein